MQNRSEKISPHKLPKKNPLKNTPQHSRVTTQPIEEEIRRLPEKKNRA